MGQRDRRRAVRWRGYGQSWADPTEREIRAAKWEQRRQELLGLDGASSVRYVMHCLGLSARTLRRYEYDGAPPWYELALIGLARAKPGPQHPDHGKKGHDVAKRTLR